MMLSMKIQISTGNVWMTMIETGLFKKKRIWEKPMSSDACWIHHLKVCNRIGWEDVI